jgi:hypothetical protein
LSADLDSVPVVYDEDVAPLTFVHDDVDVDSAFCHWYDSVPP